MVKSEERAERFHHSPMPKGRKVRALGSSALDWMGRPVLIRTDGREELVPPSPPVHVWFLKAHTRGLKVKAAEVQAVRLARKGKGK